MSPKQLDRCNTHIYRHMSQEQATRLANARAAAVQDEATYSGPLLLTEREYYLLLPLLNPLVIAHNRRRLNELCRVAEVPKKSRQRMVRNLWLQSCIGFVPLVNVVFSRKFKCNMRNLAILEAQLQREEDEMLFSKSDGSDCAGSLPTHITKMFSKCPVYKRTSAMDTPSKRESAAISVYYSTCVSLSELGQSMCAESDSSTLDGRSESAATHATPHPARLVAVA
ncbi:hypothetical protein H4R19_001665 [Coemansia spiralis]|nr:hypothetical protein H4R19_001665 [Coemansia spiralis]